MSYEGGCGCTLRTADQTLLSSPSVRNSTNNPMSCLRICTVCLSYLLEKPLLIISTFLALFCRPQFLKVNVPKTTSEAPSSLAVEPASVFPRNNFYLICRLGRTTDCFGPDQRIDQLPAPATAVDHPPKWPSLACSGRSTPVSQSLLTNTSCKLQRRN